MNYNQAPLFFVWFRGKTIPVEIRNCITSFEFEHSEEKEDQLSLVFECIPVHLLEHDMFRHGAEIEVKWGYPKGPTSKKYKCVVQDPKYGFGETVSFTLYAFDKSSMIKGGNVNKIWKKQTAHQIAQQIAKKHKLKFFFHSTSEVIDSITQASKSDWAFLQELAKRSNFICYVDGDELHFKRRDLAQKPSYRMTYREKNDGILKSLSLEYNMHEEKGAKIQVAGASVNPKTGKPVTHHADRTTNSSASNKHATLGKRTLSVDGRDGSYKYEGGVGSTSGTSSKPTKETGRRVVMPPTTNPVDIKNKAEYIQTSVQIKMVEGNFEALGIPTWECRKVLEVTGCGKRMSGNYYLPSVKHTINSNGYTMTGKVVRNAQGGNKAPTAQGRQNSARPKPTPVPTRKAPPKAAKPVPKPKPTAVTKPKKLHVNGVTGEKAYK